MTPRKLAKDRTLWLAMPSKLPSKMRNRKKKLLLALLRMQVKQNRETLTK